MAFDVLPVPVPGSPTFNVDAQLFATGMAAFAQEANAIGSVMDLSLKSTSSTSLSIGTGSKTLNVQTGLGYVIGHPVRIASISNPSNFMDGIVTAYNSGTGSLTVNVLSIGGSGTINSWNTMVLPGGGNFASLSNNKFSGRQVFADEVTIASAATLDFSAGNSNQFVVTGTTTITAVTMDQGAVCKSRFTGACQLTHSANLQIQGAANFTTSPGDLLTFTSNGTVVRVEISKANGTAITAPTVKTAANDPTFASTTDPVSGDWVNGRALIIQGARVTTPGAAAYDFAVPAGAKKHTITFVGLSTNGSSIPMMQLCTSGGPETTGYAGAVDAAQNSLALSSGFLMHRANGAANVFNGQLEFTRHESSSNTWLCNGQGALSNTAQTFDVSGSKSLSSDLASIRITTVNGTDLIDQINAVLFSEF